jgi:hypothetical protein
MIVDQRNRMLRDNNDSSMRFVLPSGEFVPRTLARTTAAVQSNPAESRSMATSTIMPRRSARVAKSTASTAWPNETSVMARTNAAPAHAMPERSVRSPGIVPHASPR